MVQPKAVSAVGSLAGSTIARVEVSSDLNETCALTTSGTVHCWADNYLPVQISGLPSPAVSKPISLTVSGEVGCVVLANGTGYCWRTAYDARNPPALGNGVRYWGGTLPAPHVALKVKTGAPLASIVTSGWSGCALTESRHVLCWGKGDGGELGNGTSTTRYLPTLVHLPAGDLTASITSTGEGFCARSISANVRCWGNNFEGQLGRGSSADYSSTPGRVVRA